MLFVHDPGGDGRGPDALEGSFEVVVADGALDAMKRLSTGPAPDCLVAPTTLQDLPLDGFVSQVRAAAPGTAVVAVGDPPTDATATAALVEVDGYVPPGRRDELPERISRFVAERRVERSVRRHDRLARAVAAIAAEAASARDREGVESAFHDRLAAGDWYRHVLVGRRDEAGDVSISHPAAGRVSQAELATLVGAGETEFLARAIETGQVQTTRCRQSVRGASNAPRTEPPGNGYQRDDGRTSSLATAAVPLLHDGGIHGLAILSTDRTDAFDGAERELLADLGAIVGHAIAAVESAHTPEAGPHAGRGMENLVHDLRNPLGIARSHLEIAREDDEPASLDRVDVAIERMVETVDRVATGVKGEPGIEATPDDLASAAEAAWQSIESRAATLEVADSATIRADHDLLVRLLSNLFQNAVDHAGESVTVTVGTLPGGFYVEDDGPGIPATDRETVVDRGYSTSDDGLGIGLSIVEDVATAHGWRLDVTEAEGGGARFELSGVEQVEERTT